jgi:serine/threonine protein kinase
MTDSWEALSDRDLKLIDDWCDRFEARWGQGEYPVIESIVRSVPAELRNYLCRELVFLEFDLRQQRGEGPTLDEYLRRFPEVADQIKSRDQQQSASSRLNPRVGDESTRIQTMSVIDRSVIPGQIAQYQLLETVGESEVGPIVRVMDPKRRRIVLATVLSPELAACLESRRAFLSAARSVAAIADAHVAAVFETFESDSIVCQFQEYVIGESLKSHIENGMTPSQTEIARIGWQAASGLAAAHQQGVVHGGLTTASLILENGLPRIKIIGFGQREVLEAYRDPNSDSLPVRSTPPTPGSDLHDLGGILYTLCAGKPFEGSARLTGSGHPSWLATAVDRLLTENPGEGFPSAAALASHLSQGLSLQSPQTDSVSHARIDLPVVRKRHPATTSVVIVLALIAAASLVAWRIWMAFF